MRGLLYFIETCLALAVFIVGLRMMSSALQSALGARVKVLLSAMTRTPLLGVLTGIVATACIQSSSAVAAMMVGLVHSKVLTLYQAFGIILGANIGTTVTAQLISFDLTQYSWVFMLIGLLLALGTKKFRSHGEVLFGFGGLILGLDLLSRALIPIIHLPLIRDAILGLNGHPISSILLGTAATAIIQSSSAVNGIVIALAKESAISVHVAVAVSLGGNIGTVVTTLISSIGLTKEAKATAYADLVFNVLGVFLIFPWFYQFLALVQLTSENTARQVANAHTIFNVVTAVLAIPFINSLTRLTSRWAGIKVDIQNYKK